MTQTETFNYLHCQHIWLPGRPIVQGATKCVSKFDTIGRRRPNVSGRPNMSQQAPFEIRLKPLI